MFRMFNAFGDSMHFSVWHFSSWNSCVIAQKFCGKTPHSWNKQYADWSVAMNFNAFRTMCSRCIQVVISWSHLHKRPFMDMICTASYIQNKSHTRTVVYLTQFLIEIAHLIELWPSACWIHIKSYDLKTFASDSVHRNIPFRTVMTTSIFKISGESSVTGKRLCSGKGCNSNLLLLLLLRLKLSQHVPCVH